MVQTPEPEPTAEPNISNVRRGMYGVGVAATLLLTACAGDSSKEHKATTASELDAGVVPVTDSGAPVVVEGTNTTEHSISPRDKEILFETESMTKLYANSVVDRYFSYPEPDVTGNPNNLSASSFLLDDEDSRSDFNSQSITFLPETGQLVFSAHESISLYPENSDTPQYEDRTHTASSSYYLVFDVYLSPDISIDTMSESDLELVIATGRFNNGWASTDLTYFDTTTEELEDVVSEDNRIYRADFTEFAFEENGTATFEILTDNDVNYSGGRMESGNAEGFIAEIEEVDSNIKNSIARTQTVK